MARIPSRSAAAFDAIPPDPDKVGGVAEAPFVSLPDPARIFAKRAKRLAMLAPDHPLEAFLLFLRQITEAQHTTQAILPEPQPRDLNHSTLHAMPPLTRNLLDKRFAETLDLLLDHLQDNDAPAAARDARRSLAARNTPARLALAGDVFEASYPVDRLGESLYVAAALQIYLCKHAARLDPASLRPVADGICPACGGAPVASMVVGWTQASKARYLCCSLCSTLWNHVRIKCTACAATAGVSYYNIEGSSPTVAAETCSTCRSYLKHLHQHQDGLLEPFADDVASYGLDLLMRQDDFHRSGVNPLFVSI